MKKNRQKTKSELPKWVGRDFVYLIHSAKKLRILVLFEDSGCIDFLSEITGKRIAYWRNSDRPYFTLNGKLIQGSAFAAIRAAIKYVKAERQAASTQV